MDICADMNDFTHNDPVTTERNDFQRVVNELQALLPHVTDVLRRNDIIEVWLTFFFHMVPNGKIKC